MSSRFTHVNREDTEPSDITDLYHGTRDHRDASLS